MTARISRTRLRAIDVFHLLKKRCAVSSDRLGGDFCENPASSLSAFREVLCKAVLFRALSSSLPFCDLIVIFLSPRRRIVHVSLKTPIAPIAVCILHYIPFFRFCKAFASGFFRFRSVFLPDYFGILLFRSVFYGVFSRTIPVDFPRKAPRSLLFPPLREAFRR